MSDLVRIMLAAIKYARSRRSVVVFNAEYIRDFPVRETPEGARLDHSAYRLVSRKPSKPGKTT